MRISDWSSDVCFSDLNVKALFEGKAVKALQNIRKAALRKLDMLDAAVSLRDLGSPPGNHLEALKGDREGQHSIRINRQYRICFVWNDGAEDRKSTRLNSSH